MICMSPTQPWAHVGVLRARLKRLGILASAHHMCHFKAFRHPSKPFQAFRLASSLQDFASLCHAAQESEICAALRWEGHPISMRAFQGAVCVVLLWARALEKWDLGDAHARRLARPSSGRIARRACPVHPVLLMFIHPVGVVGQSGQKSRRSQRRSADAHCCSAAIRCLRGARVSALRKSPLDLLAHLLASLHRCRTLGNSSAPSSE